MKTNTMKLSELFHRCAYDVEYQQVGLNVNYAFETKGKTLYIYFQGSSSVVDWVRNFLFGKRPYKDMMIPYRVHRGFLAAWKEVEDIIIEKITETITTKKKNQLPVTEYKWKKIVVVGYSHGGTLAGLCHECVWYWRPDLRDTGLVGYGFEASRFFASCLRRKRLRERWNAYFVIRTNNDIVTHCPPCIFGYSHVGSIIKVKGDTSLVQNRMPKCIKSHYPEVVYDALVKAENDEKANEYEFLH